MNEKFVINIGRQLGSGGKAVGERLAERFGIPVYDKRLIKMAAEHSGFGQEFFEKADEKPAKGFFATLLGYLRSPFAGDDAIYNNPLSHDALFKMQSDVIRQLAERESCIFVGRCADYVLEERKNVLNVFIRASMEYRVKRAMDLYEDLLTLREPPMRILFLIARQFNQLLLVRELQASGADRGTVASKLKVPPFVAGKLSSQAAAFTKEQLISYVQTCVDAEEAVKTGRMGDRLAVELLISQPRSSVR